MGYRLLTQRQVRELERQLRPIGTPTPVFDNLFDESKFSTKEYVNAVGRGRTTDFVQVRGVITSWENEVLKVKVTDQTLSIKVPKEVMVRCMSETIKDASGKELKTSEIYLDFTQTQVKGNLIQSSLIPSEISVGEDATVQAKLEGKQDLTAELIVGYGCSIGLVS